MKRSLKIGIPACLVVLAAVVLSNREFPPDSWNRFPSETQRMKFWEKPSLDESEIHVVPEALEASAIARLENRAIISLTPFEAASYKLVKNTAPLPDAYPYLIRALIDHEPGHYAFYQSGSSIWIDHGSMGHSGWQQRKAVVVYLKQKPKELFVSASTTL